MTGGGVTPGGVVVGGLDAGGLGTPGKMGTKPVMGGSGYKGDPGGIVLLGGRTGGKRSSMGVMVDNSPKGGASANCMGVPNCMGGNDKALVEGSWLWTGN